MGRPTELSQEERADLLRRGYRPVEIWVPDLGNEALRLQLQEEAHRIAIADRTDNIMDWVDTVGPTDWDKP
ncbi:antitoxin MazE family protein [Aliirhizobium terrae]|uniref:antitoxin MazE-like protein n=1 Tax=Terrirhizobium terrae TaxID=2926709 RepID=UPI002574E0FF|nr:antitoxin MazE-like protein [Rhizobium sp. CC-CFT758]WJH40608.1 antitoxin MazE family protein [Rhizobium sp. CC-CFT758]